MGTAIKIPYNTIEEFNVDSKAERGQLNLAHDTAIKYAYPVSDRVKPSSVIFDIRAL